MEERTAATPEKGGSQMTERAIRNRIAKQLVSIVKRLQKENERLKEVSPELTYSFASAASRAQDHLEEAISRISVLSRAVQGA